MNQSLDVYLHDRLVGYLEQGAELTFTYDADYVAQATCGISLSLPLMREGNRGPHVTAFFAGLLPEDSVRDRVAASLGLSDKNSFALLNAIGGDCAGALALYPHGEKPPKAFDAVEVLDDHRLTEVFALMKRRPMLAGTEGYRLSLAGAQNKLAVGFQDNRVLLIKGGAPTTHILKPPIEHVTGSAHNEFFCMTLAKMVGLDVPEASLQFVDDQTPYYLVARYDRHVTQEGTVTRIHQEDFCQALGLAPDMKYEREGGPSIATCQELITQQTARPAQDHIEFLNRVLFNYLIGNADAHGKNFSLLYRGGRPELAPAYDLLSTAVYPELSEKMAMKIGGLYHPKYVCRRHFHRLVAPTKTAQAALTQQMTKLAQTTKIAAPQLKSTLATKGLACDLFDGIIAVITERARAFEA